MTEDEVRRIVREEIKHNIDVREGAVWPDLTEDGR